MKSTHKNDLDLLAEAYEQVNEGIFDRAVGAAKGTAASLGAKAKNLGTFAKNVVTPIKDEFKSATSGGKYTPQQQPKKSAYLDPKTEKTKAQLNQIVNDFTNDIAKMFPDAANRKDLAELNTAVAQVKSALNNYGSVSADNAATKTTPPPLPQQKPVTNTTNNPARFRKPAPVGAKRNRGLPPKNAPQSRITDELGM